MDTGKRLFLFNVLHGVLTARHGIEFQPICARSIAICFCLTGRGPSKIGFLSFLCPRGPKKNKTKRLTDSNLGVAQSTMPKQQPSVMQRRKAKLAFLEPAFLEFFGTSLFGMS